MEETVKIVITIRKKNLPDFVDKFGITEYHFKNNEVAIDMTNLFDRAMQDVREQPIQDTTF